ncbi:MAG: ATPase domain-containing protein, partial [Rhodothermales bacterium]|nr:ATPase domain-containing protein [Rhodothermales bacterium]
MELRHIQPALPTPYDPVPPDQVSTGVEGFDTLLGGGLPEGRMYLVEGRPGTGKTTLALQFVLTGQNQGERALYITLSQTRAELEQIAHSHGWRIDGVDVFGFDVDELSVQQEEQTLFPTADIDLSETVQRIQRRVEEVGPTRVVFDSAAEIRLLAGNVMRTRRQFLMLRDFFTQRGITVLVLDDESSRSDETAIHLMHGVLRLEQLAPPYGKLYRRLRLMKLRGMPHPTGYHDFRIVTGGVEVFPSLQTPDAQPERDPELLKSGVESIDALLGGGLDYGASALILGVAGTGKSSLASLFALAAARKGERAAIYTFDERRETLLLRSDSLGLDVRSHVEAGDVFVDEMSPSHISSGEFTACIRRNVEEEGIRVVVLDSLTGYLATVPEQRRAGTQLHDLLVYLGRRGVLTLIAVPQHGLFGPEVDSQLDVSYLADTVLLLRHSEAPGTLCRAISVVKRRRGGHDAGIRNF